MSTTDITKVPLTVEKESPAKVAKMSKLLGKALSETKTKAKSKKGNKKASKPKTKPAAKPVPLSMRVKERSPRSIAVQIRVDKTEAAKILRDAKASGLSSMNAYGRKRLGLAA